MGYRFIVDPDSRSFVTVWHGAITRDSLRGFFHDIAALREHPTSLGVLHDLRDAAFAVGPGDDDLCKASPFAGRAGEPASYRRLALITRDADQFGQARKALSGLGLTEHVLVTSSEAEARAYIGLPADVALGPGG